MTHPHTGALFFSRARGGGLTDSLIRLGQRTWNEEPSLTSHVGIVSDPTQRHIIEQTFPEQRQADLEKYGEVLVYRHRHLSDEQRNLIVDLAKRDLGRRYSLAKNVLFAVAWFISLLLSLPVVLIGRLLGRRWRGWELSLFWLMQSTGNLVCSQTAAHYYFLVAEVEFGRPWWACKPDDMLDYCQQHPEEYELVRQL